MCVLYMECFEPDEHNVLWTYNGFLLTGIHQRVQHLDGSHHPPLSDAGAVTVSTLTESLQPDFYV